MTTAPDFAAFAEAYRAGTPQVVSTRLVADLETPVSALLKLAEGAPNSFLFESVEGGATRGRYSFLGFKPDLIWRARGQTAEINRDALRDRDRFTPLPGKPLEFAARADRRIAHGHAAEPAAHGGGPVRLHGLRHGAPGRAPARRQPGRARHPRQHLPAPHRGLHLRSSRGHGDPGDAGLAAGGRARRGRCQSGLRAKPRRGWTMP